MATNQGETAFWDASALVPICVDQKISAVTRSLKSQFQIAAWWGTPVELDSALARLLRMKLLTSDDVQSSRKIANVLLRGASIIVPSPALRVKASNLVHRHSLRAADALQLAAAFEWCENQPEQRIFLTADDRLREAARLSGFDTSYL